MTDIRESIEKYSDAISEQTGIGAESFSPASPISPLSMENRVRCLRVLIRRVDEVVHTPPDMQFPNIAAWLQYILERARERNMDHVTYKRVWGLHRIFKEHVISKQVTEAADIGEKL